MSFNLIENGQRFCKKLNLKIDGVTAENVVVDFTGIDGLEIYYANLYRKDDPANQAAGVISGTEVILGNVEPACYELKVCFEVSDKTLIDCPLNFVGNLTYDNCGGVPVVYPIYHECTDCSAIHDCVTLTSPDGSIDVQWNPDTQEWEIQDLIDVDTDQTWQGYLNDSDPENPLICFNIVDEISGAVTGEDVVCIPASNGDIEDNGDGTATITIDGEQAVVCLGPCPTLVQTITNGNEIAVYTGSDGVATPIYETITNIFATLDTSTPGEALFTINYTNEDDTQQPITVDLSALLDDTDTTYSFTETSGIITVTNLASNSPVGVFDICAIVNANCGASIVANPDGSFTVTGNDGVSETIPKGDVSVLTNTNNDQGFGVQEIGSHTADGVTTTLNETITSFIDNGDSTYTYTSEDGTVTVLTAGTDINEVVNNGDGTKTITHTSVDGTVTTWCVPTCNTTLASESGETFELASNCSVQSFDISTNDLPCETRDEDGNLISSGNGIYQLKGVSQPNNANITLTAGGIAYIEPRDCTQPIVVDLTSCILCPDGTTSNTATDVFTFVPPPIGDIRLDKSIVVGGQVGNTQGSTGDVAVITLTVCNDPNATGPITAIRVTDTLDAGLQYVSDDGGTAAGGAVAVTGQTVEWTFAGPLAPGACESIDITATIVATQGFEYIPNIAQAFGDDGVNGPDSTQDSDLEVLNELEFAFVEVSQTDFEESTGVFSFQEDFTKQPSGGLASCGISYIRRWFNDCTGDLISEQTGTLCNDDDVWTGNGIGDITPFFTGVTGNGNIVTLDKRSAALQFGLNGVNNCDWSYTIQFGGGVGGGLDVDCPIPSNVTSIEICKVDISISDNQGFVILSDDGTTTMFSDFTAPYAASAGNVLGTDIANGIIQAPSCAIITANQANGNDYSDPPCDGNVYTIRYRNADQLTLSKIVTTGDDILANLLLNNTGPIQWDYNFEISPAVLSLIPSTYRYVPIPNVGEEICNGQHRGMAYFTASCGEPMITELWFEHSCNPNVPIILRFNKSIYSY